MALECTPSTLSREELLYCVVGAVVAGIGLCGVVTTVVGSVCSAMGLRATGIAIMLLAATVFFALLGSAVACGCAAALAERLGQRRLERETTRIVDA